MASFRTPGPLIGWPPQQLNDGTSCRGRSPLPGPINVTDLYRVEQSTAASGATTATPPARTRRTSSRTVKAINLSFYGRAESLGMSASLKSDATENDRQRAIEILIKVFEIDLSMTNSIRYDKALPGSGKNVDGNIRIGPEAYTKSHGWLGQVIFHETIHSDHFAFYNESGVNLTNAKQNLDNSEALRLLYALDEVECWYYSWLNRVAFSLNPDEIKSIRRDYRLHMVDLDDPNIRKLVLNHQYHDARANLVSRLKP